MRIELPWRRRLRERAPAFDPCLLYDASGASTLAQEAAEPGLDWEAMETSLPRPPIEPTPEVA